MTDDETRRSVAVREPGVELEPALLVIQGPDDGTIHRLELARILVGRADEADLRIVAEGISRKHAELLVSTGGDVDVVDLGSTNGVFVNGVKIERAVLRLGDLLGLGPVVRLRLVDAAASTRKMSLDALAELEPA